MHESMLEPTIAPEGEEARIERRAMEILWERMNLLAEHGGDRYPTDSERAHELLRVARYYARHGPYPPGVRTILDGRA